MGIINLYRSNSLYFRFTSFVARTINLFVMIRLFFSKGSSHISTSDCRDAKFEKFKVHPKCVNPFSKLLRRFQPKKGCQLVRTTTSVKTRTD